MRVVDRGLVTHPSSEGPCRWHRHRTPRDRSDGHIWTCSSWRGADAGPSRRGRPPHGGALGGPTRQREHGFAGGPGEVGGGSAVSAPAAAWAAAAPPRATVAPSARGGPEPLGRRPSMNVGGRRTGQAQGSALRGRLLTSGPAASAEVGAGDAHGATTRPPSEAEPAGRAITISG